MFIERHSCDLDIVTDLLVHDGWQTVKHCIYCDSVVTYLHLFCLHLTCATTVNLFAKCCKVQVVEKVPHVHGNKLESTCKLTDEMP